MGFVANYVRNLLSLAVGREPTRPLLFSYYVTHRCKLRCEYCSDGHGRPFHEDTVAELGTDDAKRLITLLSAAADTLDVTGGEPLLRDDLEDLLAFARARGMRTVLNTNGLSLPDRPDVLANCDVLVISLDAVQPARLGEIIGRDAACAERILDAVRYACRRRHETRTAVVLSTVALPGRLSEVERVLAFAAEGGLAFQLSPRINGTTAHPDLRDSPQYRRLLDAVIAAKRSGVRVLGLRRYLRGIRDFSPFRCHPLLMPTIRPDASMYYPCLESGRADVNLLDAGTYPAALQSLRKAHRLPACRRRCHLFCHMALSLLQRHPAEAVRELKYLRS